MNSPFLETIVHLPVLKLAPFLPSIGSVLVFKVGEQPVFVPMIGLPSCIGLTQDISHFAVGSLRLERYTGSISNNGEGPWEGALKRLKARGCREAP